MKKCDVHKSVKKCQASCKGDTVLPIASYSCMDNGISQYKEWQQGIKEKQGSGKIPVKGYKV